MYCCRDLGKKSVSAYNLDLYTFEAADPLMTRTVMNLVLNVN